MAYKGLFKPLNPSKYKGDVTNIVFRSRWELRFMSFLDSQPDVIEWSSEEFFIPYKCKTDGKYHRYFPDFKIKWRSKDKRAPIVQVIEIKPKKQTVAPQRPAKITKRYVNEAMTYAKNKSKWAYAEEWCKSRGYEFKIITEKELNLRF